MMDWIDLVKILSPLMIFFGTAFFWLWTRLESKRLEDKATFVDLYQKVNKLDKQIGWLLGKSGQRYDELPDTHLI